MKLKTLGNYLEDYSPGHDVVIRLPNGDLANIESVSVQSELGIVIIKTIRAEPWQNSIKEEKADG